MWNLSDLGIFSHHLRSVKLCEKAGLEREERTCTKQDSNWKVLFTGEGKGPRPRPRTGGGPLALHSEAQLAKDLCLAGWVFFLIFKRTEALAASQWPGIWTDN